VLPRLSIVIPVTENGVERLEETLVSVLENRPETCEVIVVHAGCYHDPYDLSDEVRFVESDRHPNVVDLANLGIGVARSEIIHLLASGTLVEEGWAEPALVHFDDPDVSSVTPLVLDVPDRARIAAAGVAYGWGGRRVVVGRGRRFRSPYQPPKQLLGPTIAAAFYRASALAAAGGLSDVVGSQFADLDVAMTLHVMGFRNVFEPACNVQAAASLVTPETGAWAGGWTAERCFWRHASVQCWWEFLVAHPLWMFAEAVADAARCRWPRTIGRLAAWVCAARDFRHHDDAIRANHDRFAHAASNPLNRLGADQHEPGHPPPVHRNHRAEPAQKRALRKAG
jgi:hypothetical protein